MSAEMSVKPERPDAKTVSAGQYGENRVTGNGSLIPFSGLTEHTIE